MQGQAPPPYWVSASKPLHQHITREWTIRDGLPQMAVTALHQDARGTLWVGSQAGLAAFDGARFRTYGPWNTPGLASADIQDITEAPGGEIWIATSAGHICRRTEDGWTSYGRDHGLPEATMSRLVFDAEYGLFVGTSQGLFRWDGSKFLEVAALRGQRIHEFEFDPAGRLWLALDEGFWCLEKNRLRPVSERRSTGGARAAYRSASGTVWIADRDGLARIRDGTVEALKINGLPVDFAPTCLLAEDTEQILVGTDRLGLIRLLKNADASAWEIENLQENEEDPTYLPIGSLTRGREGALWCGTLGFGLFCLRNAAARTIDIKGDLAWCVARTTQGELLIGTAANGLVIHGGERNRSVTRKDGLPSNSIVSLLESSRGDIWIGTEAGAAVWDGEELKPLAAAFDLMSEMPVYGLLEDRRGRIWFGGSKGLFRWEGQTLTRVGTTEQFENTWYLAEDTEGAVWVIVSGRGVFSIAKDDTVQMMDLPAVASVANLTAMTPWKDGWIIGTSTGALHFWTPAGTRSVNLQIQETPCVVNDLKFGPDGRLWLNIARGVVRIDADDLFRTSRASGRVEDFGGLVIDSRHGISSLELNHAGNGGIDFLDSGEVVVPGITAEIIDPSLIAPNLLPPQIRVVGVDIDGQMRRRGSPTVVPPGSELTGVRFDASTLLFPDRYRFRYKLEGYHETWIDAGDARRADFRGVPSGSYTFRLIGANESGIWNEAGDSVRIEIEPQFTETLFFKIGALALVIALAALFFRWRIYATHNRAKELDEKVRMQTQILEAEVSEKTRIESELRRARENLELRVEKRTSELEGAYDSLQRDLKKRRRLERQLQRAQKLESVGRLAGGIAHDLNNMLTAVLGYADLISSEFEDDSTISKDLEQLTAAGKRATRLTEQLLTFAQRKPVNPRHFDLGRLVLDLDGVLRRLIGADIELVIVAPSRPCPVHADPTQMEQVLINLVVNARDSQPRGGRIVIEFGERNVGHDSATGHQDIMPGPFVELSVTDEGTGMPREVQEKLFEPFFTTKSAGRGTGLGLAICYGIVTQNQGFIEVDSVVDRGSQFRIFIPRDESGLQDPEEVEEEVPLRGDELIVVAEDEPLVRRITSRGLKLLGYRVVEAANGEEALRVMEELDEKVDLLLTDVVMPMMNGPELAKEIRARGLDVPVVFMSGYTGAHSTDEGISELGGAFIQKPFTPNDLARILRRVLDGDPAD